jgi:hypothetical protein
MIATNEETLSELFTAAIVAMTPRLQYKGAEGWQPYTRAVGAPTTTRRFRLLWTSEGRQPGRGAAAGAIIEHRALLRVRTDYAGEHAKQQFIVADDFHQLGDTLTATKAPDTGVVLVERLSHKTVEGDEDTDVIRVDHTYRVRFMRRIQL